MARPFSEYRKRLMSVLHTHGPSDYVTLAKLADVPELWALRKVISMHHLGQLVPHGLVPVKNRRRPRVLWGFPPVNQLKTNLSHTLQQGWHAR